MIVGVGKVGVGMEGVGNEVGMEEGKEGVGMVGRSDGTQALKLGRTSTHS